MKNYITCAQRLE